MHLTDQSQDHSLRRRIPHLLRRHSVNIIVTFACLLLFIGINSEPSRGSLRDYIGRADSEPSQDLLNALFRWGGPSTIDIRNGHLWGLITCNFLEADLLLLFFTIVWLWTLGKFVQQRVGSLFYLWLLLSTSIFASVMQIAIFERPHYGSGSITYSMFGFVWVSSIFDPAKWKSKPDIGLLFLLWAIICFALSYSEIYETAYFTYFFGFIWGAFLAYMGSLRTKVLSFNRIGKIAVPLIVLALCSVSLFWAPWSVEWLSYQASKYHNRKEYDRAKSMYQRILEQDQQSRFARFARENLQSIQIHEMSEEAFSHHSRQDYEHAKSLYVRILELDPENGFAKENLNKIRIGELGDEAVKLHSDGKLSEARRACLEILKIDPKDEWAKECANKLLD